MPSGPLTVHEQRVLDDMERVLRRDRRLDRQLRTLKPARDPRARTVAVPLLVSVALMVAGIRTSEPAVIWAFAVVWPPTLVLAFRLLCRWTER
ncbi:DUF3040 domain-containing protein [Streptomyces sp. B93]|uniref:DUF3040 domain-containing protein n=1 Tax=Streptomyces sp. B93 TaxID=2824875 RepID=UPI001B36662B|nr:DUF3040 domain-containing protein [Streptomyces sp. B93]MBQ1093517.1 DUF3040 domain-containing protein [Streptomyces sp. B93]